MFLRCLTLMIVILSLVSPSRGVEVDISSLSFTNITKEKMDNMIHNLNLLYGENIRGKFHKELLVRVSQSPGPQAWVDPYSSEIIILDLKVPYDAKEPQVLATLCHELGHLVSKGRRLNWIRFKATIATEGQADYFVPSCMQLYLETFNQTAYYLSKISVNKDVLKTCENNPQHDFSFDQCVIILQGFKDIFVEYNEEISYEKSYGKKTVLTERTHPDDQCRLDTVRDSVLGKGRNRCWYSTIFPTKPSFWDIFRKADFSSQSQSSESQLPGPGLP